jgi:excisionase family DNA binding protein
MDAPTSPAPLLSINEVVHVLGISKVGLWRLVQNGKLPVVAIGARRLFRPADVEEFVQRNLRQSGESRLH